MNDIYAIIVIAIVALIVVFGGKVGGYCVREFDMWCSSQAPQECSDINSSYPACN